MLTASDAMSKYSYPSSSTGISRSNESPVTHSTGSTPPLQQQYQTHARHRSSRPSAADHQQVHLPSFSKPAPVSVSTSPEETRPNVRSSAALGVSLSRGSLTTFGQSFSNSPPVATAIKRPSPSGSIGTSGWSTPYGIGSSRGTRSDQSTSLPKADERLRTIHSRRTTGESRSKATSNNDTGNVNRSDLYINSNARKRRITIHSALHNQDKFDNDGYASLPLLDPKLEWKFKAYRASYAHLLGAWKFYSQMAEVLKFDGLVNYFGPLNAAAKLPTERSSSAVAWNDVKRREAITSISKAATMHKVLELRRCCRECGETLQPIEKNGSPIGWHCTSPSCLTTKSRSFRQSSCSICGKIITGLMVPCLQCGHITCFACTEGWFGRASSDDSSACHDSDGQDEDDPWNESTCPSGCGCYCLKHQRILVPYPKEPAVEPDEHSSNLISNGASVRTERLMSVHGPDSAIGAFLSLTRTRSISAPKDSILVRRSTNDSVAMENYESNEGRLNHNPDSLGQYGGFGRGLGGGSSRGLKPQASDLTIRKENA